MTYEITTPGRHDERFLMQTGALATLAEARKAAQRLATRDSKTMLIERVTKAGVSTIIERVTAPSGR